MDNHNAGSRVVKMKNRAKHRHVLTLVSILTISSIIVVNSYAQPSGNTFARADPEPAIIGQSVDCVGLTDIASVASIDCELFAPGVSPQIGTPFASGSDSFFTPPTFNPLPGGCGRAGTCKEFRVTFSGSNAPDTAGDWRFKITFKDRSGNPIDVQGKDVRIHSFFVVPESMFGTIALLASSLAALAGYRLIHRRNSKDL